MDIYKQFSPSVCVPIHPSCSRIILKRLNISSYFIQHMVVQSLNFHTKQLCRSWTGTLYGGVEYTCGTVNKYHDYY